MIVLIKELFIQSYQMKQYTNTLKNNKIFQSMSRKGTCLDNSLMENFFGIMKQDRSFEELEKEVINYIHYYNNDRIKEKLKLNSLLIIELTINQ